MHGTAAIGLPRVMAAGVTATPAPGMSSPATRRPDTSGTEPTICGGLPAGGYGPGPLTTGVLPNSALQEVDGDLTEQNVYPDGTPIRVRHNE